ncbi:hypothetical protein NMY22_g8364 [Coprinellus aureogranulatus]|nr:hypothetical protein NMY22_g8364 [Coprinellus aureogranulatus]
MLAELANRLNSRDGSLQKSRAPSYTVYPPPKRGSATQRSFTSSSRCYDRPLDPVPPFEHANLDSLVKAAN